MRARFLTPCAALALLAVAVVAPAQSTDAATAQRYATLTKQAAIGDAKAQYDLGLAYASGDGGNWPKDEARAVGWIRRAAEQGYANAQYELGVIYGNGKGVPRDYTQAALWYRKAAEQGQAYAQNNLGAAYHEGHGVPQDYAQAALWIRKAAEQGNALGQISLGSMYYVGNGVPKDYAESYFWFDLAASGTPLNKEFEEQAYKARDDAASKLKPEVLLQTQERARKWFDDHTAKTNPQ